jgi:hypothetical protein
METQGSYNAPNKIGQVTSQMQELEKLTVEINEISENLEKILAPILPRQATVEGTVKEKTYQEIVPLADNLRTDNARLYMAITRLNDILARCEL